MADEDDLYADLYAEEGAGADDGDLSGNADKDSRADDGHTGQSNGGQTSTKASFIPPPAASSSNNASSFIPLPPPQAAPAKPAVASGSSFIPPTANTSAYALPRAQIETAPMTNTDQNRMGSSSLMSSMQPASRPVLPHEMPDEGKLFVGGLNWDTTDEGLKHYFSQFGKVNHCLIMRDPHSGRSRGFAFLTFDDPKAVNSVMVKEHFLDGKMIDPKRAIPRQDNVRTAKCFVGGVPSTATSESFRAFFDQFGSVLDSTLMLDRDTQKPRGYGFVTFDNDATVERLLQVENLAMDGKLIEVKRATPRNNVDGTRRPIQTQQGQRTEPMRGGGGRYGDDSSNSVGGGAMGMGDLSSMGGVNPLAAMMMNPMFAGAFGGQHFDPMSMANFFQQQQQQGGGGTGAFNPMMFQQMMMANMSGSMGMGMANSMQAGAVGRNNSASWGKSSGPNLTPTGMRASPGGGGFQAPPSAGLPSRPSSDVVARSASPGSATAGTGGRDYQRERSPDRRGGGSGRDNRW